MVLDKNYHPSSFESDHYHSWEQSGLFAPSSHGQEPYCIMMPPPNVTGRLHMGHALTMTLQDILIRYHRLKGFNTLWQPGTDHAGIATQMVVERQLEKNAQSREGLGRDAFLKRVWQWKEEFGGIITEQLRSLGCSAHWQNERFTMDEGLSQAVIKTFVSLYEQGLIYRDKRLVNWDPKLLTAISDLEVVQKQVNGHYWHFKYPIDGQENAHVIVATTRPETLLGDSAVAVHPQDERYQHLIGHHVTVPIVGRKVPIVADEYANPEKGTGVVKITPAHDFNDFEVGRRHDLSLINIFDRHACVCGPDVPEEYLGLDRFQARKRVVDQMDGLGYLDRIEPTTHHVPYGDRSDVVVEPYLTDQWFCRADVLAKPALEVVRSGKVRFVPKNWEKVYFDWLENIEPWCISRQLWWGHRIPAWFGPDGHVFVACSYEQAQEQAREHYGKENVDLTQEEDVLDTWFSSALWPFSTLGWPENTSQLQQFYPTNVLVTGFDIIFFWVARMLMMGLHFMDGKVPFKEVYIHALVRDEHGAKMSKSKGNVIDPLGMIEEYGADALRLTLGALAVQGHDIKLSPSRVQGYRNFITKFWNAARFCEMKSCKMDDDFDILSIESALNRWLVTQFSQTLEKVNEALEGYKFNESVHHLYQFVWGVFCDWYLELIKPILDGQCDQLRQETQNMAGWMMRHLLIVLHPFIPFVTQELWSTFGSSQCLMHQSWPKLRPFHQWHDDVKQVNWLIDVISLIRSLRSDMDVPIKAKTPLCFVAPESWMIKVIEDQKESLKTLARVSDVSTCPMDQLDQASVGCVRGVVNEHILLISVAQAVDLERQKDRIEAEKANLMSYIGRLEAKLNHEKFISKAPPQVIEDHRLKCQEAKKKWDKLSYLLTCLG